MSADSNTSAALVTAIKAGGPVEIGAIFDHVDTVRTTIKVTQVLKGFTFALSTAPGVPVTQMTLASLGETRRCWPRPSTRIGTRSSPRSRRPGFHDQ